MLHLPEKHASQRPGVAYRRSVPAKAGAGNLHERALIKDFMAARKAKKTAKLAYESLCSEHAEIASDEPNILLFINDDGQRVYGGQREINRYWPEGICDWHVGAKQRREEILAKLKVARAQRREEQEATGLNTAHRELFNAIINERKHFLAVCQHRPTTLKGARAVARIVRTYLPDVARSYDNRHFNIYGEPDSVKSIEGWKEARVDGFDYLSAFALAISNAVLRS